MRTPTTHRRTQRRNGAVRLDPYALDETTITLEEWRRLQQPARRPRRTRPSARSHRHAA